MANLYDTSVIVKPDRVKIDETSRQVTDNQSIRYFFEFIGRVRNPEYRSGIEYRSFRSCLLHNKDATKNEKSVCEIRHKPKFFTYLKKTPYDTITGEILDDLEYITDDLTSGNNRKIKALNRFVDTFKELYSRRKVSILFQTLTIADKVDITIKRFICSYKKRLSRNGHQVYGHFWVMEISDKGHIHYHLMIVTSRINCRGKSIPKYLKANDIWGARTQIEFVKRGLKYYLGKYFVKNKSRITGKRLYGQSISNDFKKITDNY